MKTIWLSSDIGGRYKGAAFSPQALLVYALNKSLTKLKNVVEPDAVLDYSALHLVDFSKEEYKDLFASVIKTVTDHYEENEKYLFLSGDHFNAAPLITAVAGQYSDLKVLWIDAHADLHTPSTSPSGNPHGMPLALLLGLQDSAAWWQNLISHFAYPVLKPENIAYVGLRSYEHPEMQRIAGLGIKVFSVEDVSDNLIPEHLQSFLGNAPVYVSFDIDVLDKALVPGTGTPVGNGLQEETAFRFLAELLEEFNVRAVEITEFNPLFDEKEKTCRLVSKLAMLVGEAFSS